MPAGLTAANPTQRRVAAGWNRQTDGRPTVAQTLPTVSFPFGRLDVAVLRLYVCVCRGWQDGIYLFVYLCVCVCVSFGSALARTFSNSSTSRLLGGAGALRLVSESQDLLVVAAVSPAAAADGR